MSENVKTIRAIFTGGKTFITERAWQYDTGHLLCLIGFDLPESYDVHFAHNVQDEVIAVRNCSGDTIRIPDELFAEAQPVLCWICSRSETTFFTLFEIRIPVLPRSSLPNGG